jgi:hypothetical protein
MRRIAGLLPPLVLVVIVGVAPAIEAHLLVPAEFREVAADASVIVRGRITDVRSEAVAGSAIDSVATVAVDTVLKGNAGRFVYVRVPGGQIGRRRFLMVGAPIFRVGERAVLFLRPSPTDATHRPIGLTLGVYPVLADAATRSLIVQPPLVPGRTDVTAGPTVRGDRRRRALTVPEFESLVRLVLAAPANAVVPRSPAGAGGPKGLPGTTATRGVGSARGNGGR